MEKFKNNKDKLLFRLTITSDDDEILKYYEPNAPEFYERMKCLRKLKENNFRTSVSIEPYLSNPISLVKEIDEYVTDDIWIGTMSGLNINDEIDNKHKSQLEKIYNKKFIMKMINSLKDNKKIYWKTSIVKIILNDK